MQGQKLRRSGRREKLGEVETYKCASGVAKPPVDLIDCESRDRQNANSCDRSTASVGLATTQVDRAEAQHDKRIWRAQSQGLVAHQL